MIERQMALLRHLIKSYRNGQISLDAVIQRIEGLSEVIGIEAWKEAVFGIVLSLEQVNALALDEQRSLTAADRASVDCSLTELEVLIAQFEGA